jgi:GTP cyclohydrolase FolE2
LDGSWTDAPMLPLIRLVDFIATVPTRAGRHSRYANRIAGTWASRGRLRTTASISYSGPKVECPFGASRRVATSSRVRASATASRVAPCAGDLERVTVAHRPSRSIGIFSHVASVTHIERRRRCRHLWIAGDCSFDIFMPLPSRLDGAEHTENVRSGIRGAFSDCGPFRVRW